MQLLGVFKIKQIHQFAREYLMSWFPGLGSYQSFNNRLNRIGGLFSSLIEKAGIQKTCKVRSTKGLIFHVYGKLAIAFISFIFNP